MAQSLYTKGLDLRVSLKLTMYSEVFLLLKGRDERWLLRLWTSDERWIPSQRTPLITVELMH